MKKKICPKCKGDGWYKQKFDGANIWLAPFTLGLSLIRSSVECRICDGKGWFYEKD